MKPLIVFFLFAFCTVSSFAQEKNFQCACSKIGIDAGWADSNKVSCFLIPVDKTYGKKDRNKYYLAVVKAGAENTTTKSPLLYLHGGPGIATLGNLRSYLKSATWKLMRQKLELVFFDYRGTGFSQPDLCNYLPDS